MTHKVESHRRMTLWRVEAPHFVAGLGTNEEGRVIHAAPILGWTLNQTREQLRAYFAKKGWRVTRCVEFTGTLGQATDAPLRKIVDAITARDGPGPDAGRTSAAGPAPAPRAT